MAMGLYKPGQGYWTRLMSGIGFGMIVLMGGIWLSRQVTNVRLFGLEPVWSQAIAFSVVVAAFGIVGFYLIGRKPNFVDFLIATEGEMKKVNWSSKKEIMGSTWVVIAFTVFVALFCFAFDRVYQFIFIKAGVLEF
ncbi:MAG TPA: preprotein translocase subunit SecE [Phycisphaerales bacterium]|nr:preprotein translocase subunit SecE [Phycisphaerales bacterium]HRQ76046.1 preprotein translocase subunit SecE [Phycisphaerales bacterium]